MKKHMEIRMRNLNTVRFTIEAGMITNADARAPYCTYTIMYPKPYSSY